MSVQNASTVQPRILNGVDVAAMEEFVTALEAEPGRAQFQFRVRNAWVHGAENRSEIRDFRGNGIEDRSRRAPFVVTADEPAVLFGSDRGPNPGEFLLHALAACVTTTLAQEGAAAGIAMESIECEVRGDIDLRGPLGLAADVPKGLALIRVSIRARTPATPEEMLELARKSPVYNTLIGGVPIELAVETR